MSTETDPAVADALRRKLKSLAGELVDLAAERDLYLQSHAAQRAGIKQQARGLSAALGEDPPEWAAVRRRKPAGLAPAPIGEGGDL